MGDTDTASGAVNVAAPGTLDAALQEFAAQIHEDPKRLRRRPDAEAVLEQVGKGVLVDLSISRPRFMARLRPQDLGLSSAELGVTASAELRRYIQLGRRSLLPKELQDELARTEVKARETLYAFSVDSPWRKLGHFVASKNYLAWKEANEECERRFWALRDRVVAEYPKLVARVLRDYLKFALENWRCLEVGSALLKSAPAITLGEGDGEEEELDLERLPAVSPLTQEIYEAVLRELQLTQEQALLAAYVREYLEQTRAKMPTPEVVANAFVYQVQLNFVTLPSLLARDLTAADRIFQERSLADAQYQMELVRLREQERLQLEFPALRSPAQVRGGAC